MSFQLDKGGKGSLTSALFQLSILSKRLRPAAGQAFRGLISNLETVSIESDRCGRSFYRNPC